MTQGPRVRFGPYQLDAEHGQLWRGAQVVKVVPKALAVLRVLITRPGQVVTKEELFQVVWPQIVVSDTALTSCMKELRQVLRDDAQRPRYIETVHRRGYRFIAPLSTQPVQGSKSEQRPTPPLVGREKELRQLHAWLNNALRGERQIVFITGEPGIGKTALVEAFLAQVAAAGAAWIGRGQCIEHYGVGEAYLPLLEALGRLCREPGSERLIAVLDQYAPTWLVQLPSLLSATELKTLQRKTQGATRGRMLRELAEAIEVMTAERPVVLRLEDLHWSDVSTLD